MVELGTLVQWFFLWTIAFHLSGKASWRDLREIGCPIHRGFKEFTVDGIFRGKAWLRQILTPPSHSQSCLEIMLIIKIDKYSIIGCLKSAKYQDLNNKVGQYLGALSMYEHSSKHFTCILTHTVTNFFLLIL